MCIFGILSILYVMRKEHLIKEFRKLTFDEKKQKVIHILNAVKDSDKIFMDALKYSKIVDVDEEYLEKIYIDIIELGNMIIQKNEMWKAEAIQKKIQKINEQEAKEKETELLDFNF